MLGAITGDIVGSRYEFNNLRSLEFSLFDPFQNFFTDDTVLTVALADAILHDKNYADIMRDYYQRYPGAGYGSSFRNWACTPGAPAYNSWGNGSAMRISPVAYAFDTLEEVLVNSQQYTEITHNHPEGIKGAAATVAAIFLARTGHSKVEIKDYVEREFGYDLNRSCDKIRPCYVFNESCQETVPEAIIAFLESTDFENAVRLAVSLGGDSDTLSCITGSIAEAFYGGVPKEVAEIALSFLDDPLRDVTLNFTRKYCPYYGYEPLK